MKRLFAFVVSLLLLFPCVAGAQTNTGGAPGMGTTEQDGDPDIQCIVYRFDNGIVTDNLDGSCDIAGGGGAGTLVTINSSAADTTANFLDGNIDWTLVDGGAGGPDDVTGTLDATYEATLDVATSVALAANPNDCGGGEFANAIAANGDLSCATPPGGVEVNNLETITTGIETTEIPIGTASNTVVYAPLSGDVSMDNAGAVTVNTSAVADALASDPTDCSANQFANAIVANGNLTCAGIVDADVPDDITIDLAATATALAANPSDCTGSQFANAIAANGDLTCATVSAASSSGAVTEDINQSAHGFAVGNVLYHNGTIYALADASAIGTAESIGIVSAISPPDDFTLQTIGRMTGLSGLTIGEAHFLSETPGVITPTPVSTVGAVNKPILIADSATSGFVFNMKGDEVGIVAGAAETLTESIPQTAHTLNPRDVVYHNGTIYVLADASASATAEVIGIVLTDDGANSFTLQTAGKMIGFSGLTAGESHFLSTTAGQLTATAPSVIGEIIKPILIADSTTSGFIFNMRGTEVGSNAETNSLEVITTGITSTEIPIGTAANTVAYAPLSGDVTMDNAGAVTIAAAAVEVSMIANGTDGELITWDASGVADTVAVGTLGDVLTSGGTGVAPTFTAPAAAGAVTLLSNATSSGIVSGDLTIEQDKDYMLVYNGVPTASDVLLGLRFNNSSTGYINSSNGGAPTIVTNRADVSEGTAAQDQGQAFHGRFWFSTDSAYNNRIFWSAEGYHDLPGGGPIFFTNNGYWTGVATSVEMITTTTTANWSIQLYEYTH